MIAELQGVAERQRQRQRERKRQRQGSRSCVHRCWGFKDERETSGEELQEAAGLGIRFQPYTHRPEHTHNHNHHTHTPTHTHTHPHTPTKPHPHTHTHTHAHPHTHSCSPATAHRSCCRFFDHSLTNSTNSGF